MKTKEFFNKVFRWEIGRQKSGYDKMLLLTGTLPIPFDVYILRFLTDSEILEHVDSVDKGRHFRLNIIIRKAQLGGVFYCADPIFATKRIKLFRPDISAHSVSKIEKGVRYVFSVGWIRP